MLLPKLIKSVSLLITIVCMASCGNGVDGLFNNISDSKAALQKHEEAWLKQMGSREISRRQVMKLLEDKDGNCVTETSNWKAVEFESKPKPIENIVPIACYFDVRGRFPWDIAKHWRWTVLLSSRPAERFAVLAFRRSQGSEFSSPDTSERNFQKSMAFRFSIQIAFPSQRSPRNRIRTTRSQA